MHRKRDQERGGYGRDEEVVRQRKLIRDRRVLEKKVRRSRKGSLGEGRKVKQEEEKREKYDKELPGEADTKYKGVDSNDDEHGLGKKKLGGIRKQKTR